MDGGALRGDGSRQFDRRQIARRPHHRWMDRLVLERTAKRLRPGAEASGARTVPSHRDRSDRRIARDARIFLQAPAARNDADPISIFRLSNPDQKDDYNRRRSINKPLTANRSTIALPSDHIDHPERRDDVRDHAANQHLVQRAHPHEAWRPDPHPIRTPTAVAHDIKAQLAVRALNRLVDLAGGNMASFPRPVEIIPPTPHHVLLTLFP